MRKLTEQFRQTKKEVSNHWEKFTAITLILISLLFLAWLEPKHDEKIITGLIGALMYILARQYPEKKHGGN